MIGFIKSNRKSLIDIGVLLAIYMIAVILVDPIRDFPVNDDWSYSLAVKNLLNGEIRFTGWTSMPLIGHVLWGGLFAYIFGYSFTVLRISVAILGFAGAAGTYFLSKQAGIERKISLMGAIVLALTPFYFHHAVTFHTDITFYAFAVWSCYYYLKFLDSDKTLDFIAGSVFMIYCILVRDVGLNIPFAFAVAYGLKKGIKQKNMIYAFLPIALLIIAVAGFRLWLELSGKLPYMYDDGRKRILITLESGIRHSVFTVLKNFVFITSAIGFYLLPIIILVYKDIIKMIFKWKAYALSYLIYAVAGFLMMIHVQTREKQMNFVAGQIYNYTKLPDVHNPSAQYILNVPPAIEYIIAVLSFLAGGIIILLLINLFKHSVSELKSDRRKAGKAEFLLVLFIIYFVSLALAGIHPKYIIYFIPFMLGIMYLSLGRMNYSKLSLALYSIAALIFAYNSISTSYDTFSLLSNKWAAAKFLMKEKGIPAGKIDGGFEFNALNFYDSTYRPTPDKNWWWVKDDEYVVTFGRIKGYDVVKEFPFDRTFLPGMKGMIFAMRRNQNLH